MTAGGARGRAPLATELARAAAFRTELRRFLRRSGAVTSRAGLTSQRYDLLLMIRSGEEAKTPVRVTDLCELLQMQQTAVTELVRRAEDAGLIERRPASDDRRVSLLALTAEGDRRLMKAFRALRRDRAALVAGFDALDLRFRETSS